MVSIQALYTTGPRFNPDHCHYNKKKKRTERSCQYDNHQLPEDRSRDNSQNIVYIKYTSDTENVQHSIPTMISWTLHEVAITGITEDSCSA